MPDRPYDCELEYLESTGTQYIDTNIAISYPNDDSYVSAEVSFTNTASTRQLMGWNWGAFVGMSENSATVDGTTDSLPLNEWHTLETNATWEGSTRTIVKKLDGSVVSTATSEASGTASVYLRVFALDSTNGHVATYLCRAKLRKFSAKLNDTLVIDMIPVLKDGVGYMYDKVSGALFGNAGTGSFVLGPRVGPMFEPPSHVRRLEYLESTGTQYVDTGILGGSDLVAKVRVYWPYQNQTQGIVFGSLYKPQGGVSIRYMLQRHATYGGFYTDTNTKPAKINVGSGWYDVQLNAPGGFVSVNSTVVSKTVASYLMSKPTMYLFARHVINEDISSDDSVDNISVAGVRISSFSLERNSVIVRDFIPVMEDGVGYLFDRVSGRMFGNSGTGSFVLGPMAGDPYLLPSWARKVEYLESTGMQWIDTGVAGGMGLEIEARGQYKYRATSIVRAAFKVDNTLYNIFLLTGNASTNVQGAYNLSGPNNLGVDIPFGSWFDAKLSNRTMTVNGNTVSTNPYTVPEFTSEYSLGIFGHKNPNTGEIATTAGVVSYVKIWKNDAIVRSFIPCRILDTGYLFDEISGRFYGNNGTGSFVLGPDVREGVVPTRLNPFGVGRRQEKIRRVEYLESTGTQYVDTGVDMAINGRIECRYQFTKLNATTQIGQSGTRMEEGGTVYNRFSFGFFNTGSPGSIWLADVQNSISAETLDWKTITMDADTGACGYDGTTTVYSHNWNDQAPSSSFYMCATRTADGAAARYGSMKISSLKMWKNGTLVRDFVPVAIGSTGYLLDRVSGRLFDNQGTGSFVLGPDIVPVEYVESGGGQYVNTRLTITQGSIAFSFEAVGTNTNAAFLGQQISNPRLLGYMNSSSNAFVDLGASSTRVAFDSMPDMALAKTAFSASTTSGYVPIYLFTSRNANGARTPYAKARCRYCQFWDSNDALVRDFWPVRVGTVGALYDRVTDTVFRSATSTPLVAGPSLR